MKKIDVPHSVMEALCQEAKTNKEIAEKIGCGVSTVRRICLRLGIEMPQKRPNATKGGRQSPKPKTTHERIMAYLKDFDRDGTDETQHTKLNDSEKNCLLLYRTAFQPKTKRYTPEEYEVQRQQEEKKQLKAHIERNRKSHAIADRACAPPS